MREEEKAKTKKKEFDEQLLPIRVLFTTTDSSLFFVVSIDVHLYLDDTTFTITKKCFSNINNTTNESDHGSNNRI